jgi:hypothetical protein
MQTLTGPKAPHDAVLYFTPIGAAKGGVVVNFNQLVEALNLVHLLYCLARNSDDIHMPLKYLLLSKGRCIETCSVRDNAKYSIRLSKAVTAMRTSLDSRISRAVKSILIHSRQPPRPLVDHLKVSTLFYNIEIWHVALHRG